MWLMTPRGFFSAVQKPADREHGTITVRARVHGDLLNLPCFSASASAHHDAPSIVGSDDTDYPWRITIPHEQWAEMVQVMAEEIDYCNFKAEVEKRQGAKRHDVYLDVWSALRRLQPPHGARATEPLASWWDDNAPAPKKRRKRSRQPIFGQTPAMLEARLDDLAQRVATLEGENDD